MPLSIGTRLGPNEIVLPIGAGGMVEVYRARDPRLNREVAIKVLPERPANNPQALRRFESKAKAVAALSHRTYEIQSKPNHQTHHSTNGRDSSLFITFEPVSQSRAPMPT